MARRVTWTNNSTSYDGTNIYRDTTIDPQNLPEPIATVDPVAQGAAVEYIDTTGSGDQCYAVRDFDSSGDGALSDAYCYEQDLFAGASVGDEIQGGIYAGTITYADAREFHVVAAKQSGEAFDLAWRDDTSETGIQDVDDGRANSDAVLALGTSAPAFEHADSYSNDGFDDWYVPAENELVLVYDNLVAPGHSEFTTSLSEFRWSSTENPDFTPSARFVRFSDGALSSTNKDNQNAIRPIRRVAV